MEKNIRVQYTDNSLYKHCVVFLSNTFPLLTAVLYRIMYVRACLVTEPRTKWSAVFCLYAVLCVQKGPFKSCRKAELGWNRGAHLRDTLSLPPCTHRQEYSALQYSTAHGGYGTHRELYSSRATHFYSSSSLISLSPCAFILQEKVFVDDLYRQTLLNGKTF